MTEESTAKKYLYLHPNENPGAALVSPVLDATNNQPWIHYVSPPTIRQSIIWMDNANNIWNDLHNRYSQGDFLRISELEMNGRCFFNVDSIT